MLLSLWLHTWGTGMADRSLASFDGVKFIVYKSSIRHSGGYAYAVHESATDHPPTVERSGRKADRYKLTGVLGTGTSRWVLDTEEFVRLLDEAEPKALYLPGVGTMMAVCGSREVYVEGTGSTQIDLTFVRTDYPQLPERVDYFSKLRQASLLVDEALSKAGNTLQKYNFAPEIKSQLGSFFSLPAKSLSLLGSAVNVTSDYLTILSDPIGSGASECLRVWNGIYSNVLDNAPSLIMGDVGLFFSDFYPYPIRDVPQTAAVEQGNEAQTSLVNLQRYVLINNTMTRLLSGSLNPVLESQAVDTTVSLLKSRKEHITAEKGGTSSEIETLSEIESGLAFYLSERDPLQALDIEVNRYVTVSKFYYDVTGTRDNLDSFIKVNSLGSSLYLAPGSKVVVYV